MNGSGPIRDVYDAVADPTRRKLLNLLAEIGDEIKLKEEDFELLFKAFFSEMETKLSQFTMYEMHCY